MAFKLNIVITSTRPNRIGPIIGRWFHGMAQKHDGFEAELVDLASFNLPLLDEGQHPMRQQYEKDATKAWSASVKAADAFVFVLPEYDYFPPASFVNAIQCLSLEWNYAPAAFVGYGGVSGGLRSAQPARSLVSSVKMMPIPEGVALPSVFGQLKDGAFVANELNESGAASVLKELGVWAEALKSLRATRK